MKALLPAVIGVALVAGVNVCAQSPRFLDGVLETSDTDRDGKLTKDEAEKSKFRFLSREINRLDTDLDGTLDRKELGKFAFGRALQPGRRVRNRPRNLVEAVVTVLERANFGGLKIDDVTSARLHTVYLHRLDPMKLYFLQSDVDEFRKYVNRHDDLLKQSDESAAEAIYDKFKERFDARIEWALALAGAEFHFDEPDTRPAEPDACVFANNSEEAKERWRKEVKFQLVQLIASGQDEAEARERVRKKYRRLRENQNADSVTATYLNALARSMDPHSKFAPPDEAERAEIGLSQSLVGVGILIKTGDRGHEIVSLIPRGPAEESGRLHTGDHVLSVGQGKDGELVDVSAEPIAEVVKLVRGKAGTTVRLEVETLNGQVAVVDVVRRKVDLPGVTTQVLKADNPESKNARIGLVRIPSFYFSNKSDRSVTNDTANALEQLKREGVDAVLIDLRNNTGGYASEAVTMAGLFIDGPVMQTKNQRGAVRIRTDDDGGVSYSGPLALLVNRHSASASEILAMAIQDYRRGLVIGDSQTFGKGSAANRIDIARFLRRNNETLGTLDVTTRKFYGPTGRSTLLKGVQADIVLPSLTDDPNVGEAKERFPLTPDSIDPTDFTPTEYISDQLIHQLAARSTERRLQLEEFKVIRDAKERWITLQNRETIEFSSALLNTNEVDRLEELQSDISGRNSTDNFGENAYEAEVIRIVNDLMELRQDVPTAK